MCVCVCVCVCACECVYVVCMWVGNMCVHVCAGSRLSVSYLWMHFSFLNFDSVNT